MSEVLLTRTLRREERLWAELTDSGSEELKPPTRTNITHVEVKYENERSIILLIYLYPESELWETAGGTCSR